MKKKTNTPLPALSTISGERYVIQRIGNYGIKHMLPYINPDSFKTNPGHRILFLSQEALDAAAENGNKLEFSAVGKRLQPFSMFFISRKGDECELKTDAIEV